MPERKAGLWLAATGAFAAATYWAYNPTETPLRTQVTDINNQMGELSRVLHDEGALTDRVVMTPYFLPGIDVQLTDPYHPRIPELYDLMRERTRLSRLITEDEGLNQTRLKNALVILGPLFTFGSLIKLVDRPRIRRKPITV